MRTIYEYQGEYYEFRKERDCGVCSFYVLDSGLHRKGRWVPMGFLPETAVSINIKKYGTIVTEPAQATLFPDLAA